MAWKRHEQDFGQQTVKLPDGVEAEPWLAPCTISPPLPHLVELGGATSIASNKSVSWPGRGRPFLLQHMDHGV
jgi:hypothetical protein